MFMQLNTRNEDPAGPQVMCPEHPAWKVFVESLGGTEGCNFRLEVPGDRNSVIWNCDGTSSCPLSERILTEIGFTPDDIESSIAFFHEHGGFCDCEILLNIAARVQE
jgi:hypothetical protein